MGTNDPLSGTKAVRNRTDNHQSSSSSSTSKRRRSTLFGGLLIVLCLSATGCQMDIAGQTLPSAYYLSDDVQYYAPGPEFKLAREAAALEEQRALQISEPQP